MRRAFAERYCRSDLRTNLEMPRISGCAAMQPLAPAYRGFEFDKRRRLFIRVHNETLSVAAAMCVSNARFSPQTFVQTISR